MKRILLILSLLVSAAATVSAQDIITRNNGEDIRAKVLEVNTDDIRYVLFDEPDGPVYTLRKSEILMITYPSGRRDMFNNSYSAATMPHGITPGMKYKELRKYYNYKDYVSGYDDRWNPALMGVCSWIVPGLGQMISGEVGRGFAWFGGSAGCCLLMGIGSGLMTSSYYENANGEVYVESTSGAGTALVLASVFGMLAVEICAIVDACRVAKVKNMYYQDLRRSNYSFELRPSVDYIRKAGRVQPVSGLTFAMKF